MNDYDYRSFRVLKKFKIVPMVKAALIVKDSGVKGLIRKVKNRRKYRKVDAENNKDFDSISLYKNSIDIILGSGVDVEAAKSIFKDLKYKYNLFVLSNKNENHDDYLEINEIFFVDFFRYRSFILVSSKNHDLSSFYYGYQISRIEDVNETIDKWMGKVENLKLIANYNDQNNVTVRTETFFNADGTNYYSGGAERYLVDLHAVAKNINLNLNIYQDAHKPYFRKYGEVNVIGFSAKDLPLNYSPEYIKVQSKNYIDATKYFSKLHFYSAFYDAYPYCIGPSIGISHGVAWDNPNCKTYNGQDFWLRNERIIQSAQMCDKMVSVDTNTANWFQTIDFELGNQRIKVIPNYVDTKEFTVPPRRNDGKIVITYPRRLYEPRGMYLLLDVVDDLFEKYNNIEVHFVGKGFDEDVNKIKAKMKKYPDRLFCYSMAPDKMPEVYKKSDISLVPTLYSEGTSLSCLEAMATGNLVINTRIGGLTDLIINGYNGYLIEPTREDLLKTLCNVIENYDKQDVIRKRARETAEIFNKDVWNKKWTEVIKSFDIKEESSNINLVEFYVENIENLPDNIFAKIKEELEKNQLIYIRSKKSPKVDNVTGGLVQLVPFDEEVVSTAIKVYVQNGIKVDRKENINTI